MRWRRGGGGEVSKDAVCLNQVFSRPPRDFSVSPGFWATVNAYVCRPDSQKRLKTVYKTKHMVSDFFGDGTRKVADFFWKIGNQEHLCLKIEKCS